MRLYIAGQITGTTDYMERFSKAQKDLEAKGYTVINPALVNSNLPKDATYTDYMKMGFCMLELCDGIYLLKGWEKSKGATAEYHRALSLGLIIRKEVV